MPNTDRVKLLLRIVAQAYDRRSWHGANLRGSIRGLSALDAARRPAPGRHNIWEVVVHAAYWKYAVRRRIALEKRGAFPMRGSNWFVRPDAEHAGDAAWRADVALLHSTHVALLDAVRQLDDSRLDRSVGGSVVTHFDLIAGCAAHDLYHAGQIQLVKRLCRGSPGV